MSIDRDLPIYPKDKCPLCSHYLSLHIVKRYSSDEPNETQNFEINCQSASRTSYHDQCCCNAGFKPIEVTVSFKEIDNK